MPLPTEILLRFSSITATATPFRYMTKSGRFSEFSITVTSSAMANSLLAGLASSIKYTFCGALFGAVLTFAPYFSNS